MHVVDAQGAPLATWAEDLALARVSLTTSLRSPWTSKGMSTWLISRIHVLNHRHHDHYVQKFDTLGRLLLEWGGNGTGPGEFIGPSNGGPDAIAVDAGGNVYTTDPANYRVQKFDADVSWRGSFRIDEARSKLKSDRRGP